MNDDTGGGTRRITRSIGFLLIVGTLCVSVFRLSGEAQNLVVGALMGSLGTMILFYFPKDHDK